MRVCSPVPADVEARSWYWNVFVKHSSIIVLSLSLHKTSPFQFNWLVREPQAPAVSDLRIWVTGTHRHTQSLDAAARNPNLVLVLPAASILPTESHSQAL